MLKHKNLLFVKDNSPTNMLAADDAVRKGKGMHCV